MIAELDDLQNILLSDPWVLPEALGVLFFLTIILIILLVYNRSLRQRLNTVLHEKSVLHEIIQHDSETHCWWIEGQKELNCSRAFTQLMCLNLNHPITLIDITNQIGTQEAFQFNQAIQELCEKETAFIQTLKLLDPEITIQITGSIIRLKNKKIFTLSAIEIYPADQNSETPTLTSLKEITQERDFLRTLVDIAPIALWCRDKNNAIRYCNMAYAGTLETDPDSVIATSKELIEKNRSVSPYAMAIKAKKSNLKQVQRAHIIIDGQRRLIEMAEIPLSNQEETVGYALDITEVEDAVTDLEEHISTHHEIIEHLSTPIAIFGSDTHLQFFNSAYQKLFGFDEAWLHTKPPYGDIIQALHESRKLPEHPDFVAYKNSQIQLFKTLINPLQELIHQPDDHILRLMIAPHPMGGLLFLFDDVTDKLALERRHNTLIAVQKETLDHLYEGIIVFGSDNRLRLSNPALCKIWQLDPLELAPGRHATDLIRQISHLFVGVKDFESFQEQLITILSKRESKTGRFILVDQSMVQYAYVPLPDGSHLLSFIDVSDRWRFEQALQQRNQALEHADRLKSDFISHVSYELRAPLNTIIGFTEIMTNQYFGALNERQFDYCRGISESSQRLLSLINDILDLASIEAGQMALNQQTVDLETFMTSVIGLVYNRAHDQGLEISHHNTTGLTKFIADERRLKQALFNLLTNAIKFTPAGGHIDLKASLRSNAEDHKELCLSVIDTGVGITEQDQARIFKIFERGPFQNTKMTGAGLGLSLVKRLIELHRGYVEINSTHEQGTTIVCIIPLVEPISSQDALPNELTEEEIHFIPNSIPHEGIVRTDL